MSAHARLACRTYKINFILKNIMEEMENGAEAWEDEEETEEDELESAGMHIDGDDEEEEESDEAAPDLI